MDPILGFIGAIAQPIGNLVDDYTYTDQERIQDEIKRDQIKGDLERARLGYRASENQVRAGKYTLAAAQEQSRGLVATALVLGAFAVTGALVWKGLKA